ncbi:MAG TPA: alpha/beta fold hydrolase [Acidimicrobiales bacterium]|nr:alpha/beta fold hydrolase [Acidimicrobiales bacterium]
MTIEVDVAAPDGRTLHAYDAGTGGPDALAIVWHHGTPNIGLPPEPLFAAADRLGLRWVSYDRPGYGGSTPHPDRDIASAARDVLAIVDSLGIDRFAVMGHSGGGPHALACAALLGRRVVAAVSVSGLAPFGGEGLDWFGGMSEAAEASLRAAARGRAAKEAFEASNVADDPGFIPADLEAFQGAWGWFGKVVGPALAAGPSALIDDDLAYVRPWGFDPVSISVPVLFVHGGSDRMVPSSHSVWLASRCQDAELRVSPDDGHISILRGADAALEWVTLQVR